IDFLAGPEASLRTCSLADAETDGTLGQVASVYSAADDALRDSLAQPGPRVVTFHNVLKWASIPLAEALVEILRVFKDGLGGDVEIEFAVDLNPPPLALRSANPADGDARAPKRRRDRRRRRPSRGPLPVGSRARARPNRRRARRGLRSPRSPRRV